MDCIPDYIYNVNCMCVRKFRNLFVLLLAGSFMVSCGTSTKSICKTKKVRPADVWYKSGNSNKAYR